MARAEGRGELGADVHAGFGYIHVGAFRAGASAWYRLIPALALGVSGEGMVIDGGSDVHIGNVWGFARAIEGFVEARVPPPSLISAYARLSTGAASYQVNWEHRLGPILELEAGPELRVFPSRRDTRPIANLFLRLRGTLTVLPDDSFVGWGLGLGFEI